MAIAFARVAHNGWGASAHTTPVVVTITINAGETVVVGTSQTWDGSTPDSGSVVTSITDTGGSTYVQRISQNANDGGNRNRLTELYSTSAGGALASSSVSVNLTADSSTYDVIVAVYTGVTGIGTTNQASGSGANPSITLTTQDNNNVVVMMLGDDQIETAFAGTNFRDQLTNTDPGTAVEDDAALGDKSSATPALLTLQMTAAAIGSTLPWQAVALELRLAPPVITVQPKDQRSVVGATATFTITATGSGTLHYQWKLNGANVGSDANSYTTAAATMGDNLSIVTCVVTDDVGSTTSNGAYWLVAGCAPIWPYKA